MNKCSVVAFLTITMFLTGMADAENWPSWRGPTQNGLAAAMGNPPLTWSETENIRWKVAIPGEGNSTPVVWGDKIFVTTAVRIGEALEKPRGRRPRGEPAPKPTNAYKFNLMCLDRNTGEILWERTAAEAVPHEGHHVSSTYSPQSAMTDGEFVWISFGSQGIHCYDMDGNSQWDKPTMPLTISNEFGEGASAVLAGDAIVVTLDHEGESKIVAYNKADGSILWEKARDEESTWATPLVEEIDGTLQVITAGQLGIRGYNAKNGELLWEMSGLLDSAIPMPVVGHGNVYLSAGYQRPQLKAVKLGVTGEITDESVVWQVNKNTPYVSSPLLWGDRIYVTRGLSGSLSSFNALTGEAIYERGKLEGIRQVYASPVGVANRIYIPGRKGLTIVVKHSDTFEILASNQLDDGLDGSPVVIGDVLYLRGAKNLYCIAEK
ncbi:MAG: PQQ-binding-like beta-propeller repeat protein [Candidatus Hydrogenedentota bacterium]